MNIVINDDSRRQKKILDFKICTRAVRIELDLKKSRSSPYISDGGQKNIHSKKKYFWWNEEVTRGMKTTSMSTGRGESANKSNDNCWPSKHARKSANLCAQVARSLVLSQYYVQFEYFFSAPRIMGGKNKGNPKIIPTATTMPNNGTQNRTPISELLGWLLAALRCWNRKMGCQK